MSSIAFWEQFEPTLHRRERHAEERHAPDLPCVPDRLPAQPARAGLPRPARRAARGGRAVPALDAPGRQGGQGEPLERLPRRGGHRRRQAARRTAPEARPRLPPHLRRVAGLRLVSAPRAKATGGGDREGGVPHARAGTATSSSGERHARAGAAASTNGAQDDARGLHPRARPFTIQHRNGWHARQDSNLRPAA